MKDNSWMHSNKVENILTDESFKNGLPKAIEDLYFMKEVTLKEIPKVDIRDCPSHMGTVNKELDGNPYTFLWMWWDYSNDGLAIASTFYHPTRFFVLGCTHPIEERTYEKLGRCYTKETCKACGWTRDVDSSD